MNHIVNRVNNTKGLLVLLVVFTWTGRHMTRVGLVRGSGTVLPALWGSWVCARACSCSYTVSTRAWARSPGHPISPLAIHFKNIYIYALPLAIHFKDIYMYALPISISILVGLRLRWDFVKEDTRKSSSPDRGFGPFRCARCEWSWAETIGYWRCPLNYAFYDILRRNFIRLFKTILNLNDVFNFKTPTSMPFGQVNTNFELPESYTWFSEWNKKKTHCKSILFT